MDPPAPGAAAVLRSAPWPLVGRGQELELVVGALGSATRAVLIHGPAGVGKTRLSSELLQRATAAGRTGGRATATRGTASTPLGALAPLLPHDVLEGASDPVSLYRATVTAMRERSPHEPFVLLVDDLHLLDAPSATLLVQLLDAGVVLLVATFRTGEALPDAVVDLWRREHVVDVDVAELSADDVDSLLHLALGGPVEGPTLEQLWSASRGNPLFLRELVLGALSSGQLVDQRGVWRLTGPLPATARLLELVEARVAATGGTARTVLDVLALWEPLGLEDLDATFGPGPLEVLDEAGLVSVQLDGRRQQVRLSHPLHGEVLRARMATLAKRRHLLDQAAGVERRGARRREDPLRIATARLEAAGSADPVLLVTAARLARYGNDFRSEERLARAALAAERTPEAVLLLAEALHELGAFDEVERLLTDLGDPLAEDADIDGALAVQLVALRVRNLVWGLHRADDALALSRSAQPRTADDDGRNELLTDEALVLLFSGRPLAALETLGKMKSDSPRARALAVITEAPALIMTGQCETAIETAREALRQRADLDDQLIMTPPRVHLLYEIHALTEAGRLAEASGLAADGRRIESEEGLPDGQMWFALNLGRISLLTGQPRTARRWLVEGVGLSVEGSLAGPRRLLLSLLATCLAWSGDAAGAASVVAELEALPPFAYLGPEQSLGPAWAAVALGNAQRGRRILLDAAAEAEATGHRSSEAWLLHDVARLGDPKAVVDRLGELAGSCQGALVRLYADAARAAAAADPLGLATVADRFEALGALLLAAEAATAGSSAARRRGDQRGASRLQTRATALVAHCEGARTPGLVTTEAAVPLTAREREIAMLAADGCSSKEIAERLYLSVRTVSNHLQGAYTKLGVTSRAQLTDALRATADATEPPP